MDSNQRQLVNKYLDLFLRRNLFIVSLILLSLPIGLGVYLLTPKVYQSTSLLSYQQQKISSGKISADIAARIRDTVSTLTQIVTSRTNLESLIEYHDLYPEARKKLPMEDIVDTMRKKIKIEPSKNGDIFKITFDYVNPHKVVKVTNALASKFIEENLKYREERATETSAYTGDELRMAKIMMDRKESAMRDYKVKHYNEMPEQRISNVSRLIALQEQYQGKQESIQDLERTLVLIQDQLNNRKQVLQGEEDATARDDNELDVVSGAVSKSEQLSRLKRLLSNLQTRYTEKHPEVKRTKSIIRKLENDVAASNGDADSTEGNSELEVKTPVDKITLQLETQRKSVLLNIANIKEEKEQLKEQVAQYELWVTAAPVREAEWSALTREYGQLKRHYEYLVAQDLEAKSLLNLERRQKGSQFKIEDPARFPEKPVKPHFLVIMGMTVLVGLGAGVGLTLVFDFFDTTFRDPDTIETSLGVPLLSSVPHIATTVEAKRGKRKLIIQLIFLTLAFCLIIGLFSGAWLKGYIVI